VRFEILLDYLESHLLDPAVYGDAQLKPTTMALARLRNYDDPYVTDAPYDEPGDRVVEHFKFYGSRLHERNPRLRR
jgi:hypothetical protein